MNSQCSATMARSAGSAMPATASAASGELAVGIAVLYYAARVQAHVFDGTYELFRAWFGAPPAQHEGREVGATRAFLQSLARVLRSGAVTHGGVAFDTVIESFRNELFVGYKTGEGIEPNLLSQFPLVERAAEALGLV